MKPKNTKEMLANLLAEAKYAEKQVEKLKTKLPSIESRIKQALKAGDRELAKKYALQFEQLKLDIKKAEKKVVVARTQYERGKHQTQQLEEKLESAETVGKLAESMGAIAKSMEMLEEGEDMLKKIEQDAALQEARLEIALEGKDVDLEPDPLPGSAEDILKEFE